MDKLFNYEIDKRECNRFQTSYEAKIKPSLAITLCTCVCAIISRLSGNQGWRQNPVHPKLRHYILVRGKL